MRMRSLPASRAGAAARSCSASVHLATHPASAALAQSAPCILSDERNAAPVVLLWHSTPLASPVAALVHTDPRACCTLCGGIRSPSPSVAAYPFLMRPLRQPACCMHSVCGNSDVCTGLLHARCAAAAVRALALRSKQATTIWQRQGRVWESA